MFSHNLYWKVTSNADAEKHKFSRMDKFNNINLDLSEFLLDKPHFLKIFEKLSLANPDSTSWIDISNTTLDNEKVDAMAEALSSWNRLKFFHFHMKNTAPTEQQLETLTEAIKHMRELQQLHLSLNNCQMNRYKRRLVERLVRDLPNLKSSRIDMRDNKLTDSDLDDFFSPFHRHSPFHDLWF